MACTREKIFVRIAAAAKAMGCPAPFWFTGFSLGGQLALWAVKEAQTIAKWGQDLELQASDIGGGAVICPSLDSNRSLSYLVEDAWGRYLEKMIARTTEKTCLADSFLPPRSNRPSSNQAS